MRRLALLLFLVATPALATIGPARWKTLPVTYRVFGHTTVSQNTDFSKVLASVQAGFGRWQSPSCTNWRSNYGGAFTSPVGPAAVVGADRQNRVLWITEDEWQRDQFHGSQVLALTSVSRPCTDGSCTQFTDEIVDADMEFNEGFNWTLVPQDSNDIHIESVATHEAGHFAGLLHTENNTATVMTPLYNPGTVKVSLHPLDEQDICTMYPGPGSVFQGSTCTSAAQCNASAPACHGPAGGASKICTRTCTGEADMTCPSGFVCRAADTGFACLFPVGAQDLCKFCTQPNDCSNNLCASNGRNNWCTNYCLGTSDCGTNYDCVDYGATGRKVCSPKLNDCAQAQCTQETDCPVGYRCNNSAMCEARGTVGTRCELSGFCDPCNLCTGSAGEAYCRPCCEGDTEGGACRTCGTAACSSGFECTELSNMLDSVCVPNQGSPTCGACDVNTPCQDGLSCFAGRCRLACNPAQPGTCNACRATSGGAGICACLDEVAIAGQSCGEAGGGSVAICLNEDRCVGSPKACRTQCELGMSGSCGLGEECKTVDGEDVCIPGSTMGSRCAPCQNNECGAGLECVGGRCLSPCDSANPVCQACVSVAGTQGFCACNDSISSNGGACGFLSGQVRGCAPGYGCLSGTCRLRCNPASPQCPPGSSCQADETGQNVCAGEIADAGFKELPPPPQTGVTYVGCGCNGAGDPWSLLWVLGAAAPWMLRRRRGGAAATEDRRG